MHMSPEPVPPAAALDPLTVGDLCYAIERGRVDVKRHGSSFELRVHDLRRWGRREVAFRTLLWPLTTTMSFDLGGYM